MWLIGFINLISLKCLTRQAWQEICERIFPLGAYVAWLASVNGSSGEFPQCPTIYLLVIHLRNLNGRIKHRSISIASQCPKIYPMNHISRRSWYDIAEQVRTGSLLHWQSFTVPYPMNQESWHDVSFWETSEHGTIGMASQCPKIYLRMQDGKF